jgi:plastocyanin
VIATRVSGHRRPRLARTRLAAAAGSCAVLALAGCSSSSDSGGSGGSSSTPASTTSASGAAGAPTTIVIKNFKFSPASLTVAPGTVVKVMNQDSTAHTATASSDKAFDTGTIAPGKSATFTAPSKSGSYPYICTIHQFMKGTLTVS